VLTAFWLVVGATVVILALISANDETYPVYVEGAEYEKDDFTPYSFSEDQQAVIGAFGYPDGFLIMYVDGDRLETWYYYEEGFVLDFLEGIKIGEEEDSALTEIEAESTDFKPEDFMCAMTPGTALSAADIDSFVMVPLEGDLLEDAKLYYGQAIVMGFHEDELYYVETLLPED
jgi:hypothetical protein